jgi:hypothetical protein
MTESRGETQHINGMGFTWAGPIKCPMWNSAGLGILHIVRSNFRTLEWTTWVGISFPRHPGTLKREA